MKTITILLVALALTGCASHSDRYADIEAAYQARLNAISDAVTSGRMSYAEAKAAAAEAEVQANQAIEARYNARRGAMTPVLCSPIGTSVLCY